MPARVRVTPFGNLIAVASRGLLMGNRGCLHDQTGEVVRETASYKGWVTCLLDFNGRKRELRRPGRYTELFFLDEATALAAGHRPCHTCRRHALGRFLDCVAAGIALDRRERPGQLDHRLHAERLNGRAFRGGWPGRLSELPPGTIVTRMGDPSSAYLWVNGSLRRWMPDGYGEPEAGALPADVLVLTPPTVLAALRAGYEPLLHATARVNG
ncbi:hypothetical protein J5Y09_12910 [Roseomonas sp. PWR1]|uniref:Uncharacterized protein n=1 Tax=Roseomonas nitratireducens TaxID=2820810 RepID=A0ABS4ATW9_9PROT|nr:hypothetical protein [Neoroseomonas nitratireducens]MBP0464814.1 hypothetical protein [Neoroseomonas nitratireducens]